MHGKSDCVKCICFVLLTVFVKAGSKTYAHLVQCSFTLEDSNFKNKKKLGIIVTVFSKLLNFSTEKLL